MAGMNDPHAVSVNEPGSPEIPAIPENATPDEKEAHWFRHVYQGDRMPQLTLRAVIMGGILGMLMAAANLYTTLKIGWSFGVAITACVMSFAIWNVLRMLSGKLLTPMSILENNCMQSTASAAGYSTGATIATAFGALLLLADGNPTTLGTQPIWIVTAFTLVTAAAGVFLAIPLKRQMINIEQLKFPSGTLAAATLKSLYSRGAEAVRRAYALIASMVAGALVGIFNTPHDSLKFLDDFMDRFKLPRLPELVPADGLMKVRDKPLLGFGFEPSVLLVGAGMIVGMRVSMSMLAGSILLYFLVAPWLIGLDAGHADESAYVPSVPLLGGALFHPVRWALWGGTAVMVFSSLTSVALQWKTIVRSFSIFRRSEGASRHESAAMAEIEVPTSWLIGGMIPIGIALVFVQYLAFDINVWLGIIAVAMSFVLSLVACRATGETDTTPIGAMGKVMQLLFAVLSPKNIQHNLMSASVAANAASSSADLLTDLKSGYILGANPRKQFIAQFVGLFFGTIAIVPAWYLMVPDKAALEKFNPPATNMWKAVAEALTKGLDYIPVTAQYSIVFGALVGIALPTIATMFPKSAKFLPSAMGLGLSWVVTFTNSLAFAIGALIAYIWERCHRKSAEGYVPPIASGLVAGESLMKAVIAMSATAIGLLSKK